jgi:hypothetical protein
MELLADIFNSVFDFRIYSGVEYLAGISERPKSQSLEFI